MKNKFESLLNTRKQLDEVLEIVKQQNTVLEREVEENKSALYDQMFEDMYELYEYAKQLGFKYINLDTGIPAYKFDSTKTIWLSLSPNRTILLATAAKGYRDDYCFFAFKKENNLADSKRSIVSRNVDEYLYKVLANWDLAFNNIQDNLAEQARDKMERDIREAKRKQEQLMNDYNAYKKGV